MQTDTNDCQAFHNSLGSTHCAISQEEDDTHHFLIPPIKYRSKFFSEDLIPVAFETESIELDLELSPNAQNQDNDVGNSVMKWFQERGVVPGNPQEIWAKVNRELHKRTFEIIQNRSVTCLEGRNSSLLQRRLNRSMNLGNLTI